MNSHTQQPLPQKLLSTTLAVLVSVTATYAPYASAEQPTNPTRIAAEHISFSGWENPAMGHIAHYAGQLLIQHLQAAQQALVEGKIEDARKALDAAKSMAAGIQKMMPFTVVVDQLRDAQTDLQESSGAIMVGDLLPVYKSLEQMEVYSPKLAQNSHDKLKHAETLSREGDRKTAVNALGEVAEMIAATTVYMPVTYVSSQIDKAQKDLANDTVDTKATQMDISNALNSLVTK